MQDYTEISFSPFQHNYTALYVFAIQENKNLIYFQRGEHDEDEDEN